MQLIVNSVPSVSYNLTIRQQTSSVMLLIQVALIGGCVATAGALPLLGAVAILAHLLLAIESESVEVLEGVGVRVRSQRRCGLASSRFVPLAAIRSVLINEHVSTTDVYYYLAFELAAGERLMVAFPQLRPPYALIKDAYQRIDALLFPYIAAAQQPQNKS